MRILRTWCICFWLQLSLACSPEVNVSFKEAEPFVDTMHAWASWSKRVALAQPALEDQRTFSQMIFEPLAQKPRVYAAWVRFSGEDVYWPEIFALPHAQWIPLRRRKQAPIAMSMASYPACPDTCIVLRAQPFEDPEQYVAAVFRTAAH